MTKVLTVSVFGDPVTKGSMDCLGQRGKVKHLMVDSKRRELERWEPQIAAAGKALLSREGQPLDGPVGVSLIFTVKRPKTVTRDWPISRGDGDSDKLVRAVLDGIKKSGLIFDDSQVVHFGKVWQCYPDGPQVGQLDRPGVIISIWRLESAQPELAEAIA